MRLSELPRLKGALDMMGLDIGSNVLDESVIPPDWEMRAQLADDELLHMQPEEVVTLAGGEESEMLALAERAPNAHEIMNAAFDGGPLSFFFDPWLSIFDARDAEERIARSPQHNGGEK